MGAYLCPCLCPENSYEPIPDEEREEAYKSSSIQVTSLAPPLQPLQSPPRIAASPLPPPPSVPTAATPPPSAASALTPIHDNPNVFHMIPDHSQEEGGSQFDKDSIVFKGTVVEQKFFNKSTYDPKFMWVNLKSRTLCLSEHNSRDRSHKEASLADVSGVIAGPPERLKAPVGPDGQAVQINYDMCMSIKFVRGGGIDVKFHNVADRDLWLKTMVRIISQQKELEKSNTPQH